MVCALFRGRKRMTRRMAWRDELYKQDNATPWQKVEVGDRLWVRENIKLVSQGPDKQIGIIYCADPELAEVKFFSPPKHKIKRIGITPCIHMPRWASRLTLTVTSVRIEKLHEITPADAIAEGIYRRRRRDYYACDGVRGTDPVAAFSALWWSLHGIGAWALNPEVVAISFKVQRQNIDELAEAA